MPKSTATPRGTPRLILASGSPRRSDLLRTLGLDFCVVSSSVAEDKAPTKGESRGGFAQRLAKSKAVAVAAQHPEALVLGGDTIVVAEGDVLGKPAGVAEAEDMLRRLRGREHRVITGVALVGVDGGVQIVDHAETKVVFRRFTDEEMRAYIDSGAPMDKAGAYGIQDTAFHPAIGVEGCLFNVIGLPTCRVANMLIRAGVPIPEIERGPFAVPEPCRLAGCGLLR